MSRQLDPADEELLQAALSSSFTHLPPTSAPSSPSEASESSTIPPAEPALEPPVAASQPMEEVSTSQDDSYKDEYDRQLAAWRAEAEVARAKAERTRAEWEVRRKAEEEEERKRAAAAETQRKEQRETSLAGWETVSPAGDSSNKPVPGTSIGGGVGTSDETAAAKRVDAAQSAVQQHEQTFGREVQTPEPSPADSRDLVSGERSRTGTASGLNFPISSPPISRASQTAPGQDYETSTSEEDEPRISRQWEEVPSLASSFPSLPDNVMSSSSSQHDKASPKGAAKAIPRSSDHKHSEKTHEGGQHRHHHDESHKDQHTPASQHQRPVPPPSLTLSIFSPGLSAKARALAVFSSLAINMFLPFVNGVMLGFGEIFAKNFVAPLLGIKLSGPSVANVGLRAPALEKGKDRRR